MELNIHLEQKNTIQIDNIQFQKMIFIFNAVNDGWDVKKINDSYIFSKPHCGKEEIFKDDYLSLFIKQNLDSEKIIS
jgi:hypothetical protein